ncbi:MAG TPA: thiamine phosphate synthase [Candidatus Tumulicola sp.]|nr:thiamine phosphate synthase [Candidatus Tumulicola sp.]
MAAFETARLTRAASAAKLRGIYAVVNDGPDAIAVARAALDGGVRIVQYRAKGGAVAERARALRTMTRERGALFVFNDDLEAAVAFDCDGVHLGPGDRGFADPASVRGALGQRLIGLSCGTPDEARAAQSGGADYAGVGCVFPTDSKTDAGKPIGLEGLRAVAGATSLPVAAIGGIGIGSVAEVARTGVAMAAVISAIAAAPDRVQAAAELVRRWNAAA